MKAYTVQILIEVEDKNVACDVMNRVCEKVNEIVGDDFEPYSAYVLDDEGEPVY